jgi:hypothetical protein
MRRAFERRRHGATYQGAARQRRASVRLAQPNQRLTLPSHAFPEEHQAGSLFGSMTSIWSAGNSVEYQFPAPSS